MLESPPPAPLDRGVVGSLPKPVLLVVAGGGSFVHAAAAASTIATEKIRFTTPIPPFSPPGVGSKAVIQRTRLRPPRRKSVHSLTGNPRVRKQFPALRRPERSIHPSRPRGAGAA